MKLDTDYFELYEKNYRKYIPPFYQGKIDKVDVFPLISYFRIYQQSPTSIKIGQKFYVDTDTGWMTYLINPRGFFRAPHFYVGYFANRRYCKRYIFGLRGKEPILCAIQTHVSGKIQEQKHQVTKTMLQRSKTLLKQKFSNESYFDMYRIDKFVYKTHLFSNIRRFFPKWKWYYIAATKLKIFWKFI